MDGTVLELVEWRNASRKKIRLGEVHFIQTDRRRRNLGSFPMDLRYNDTLPLSPRDERIE